MRQTFSIFNHNISIINSLGWLIAMLGTMVYLLTLEPSVSFWDCGEFIATSHKFQVGHPPGAPLYQILAHCFMLLAGGNTLRLAWWSNMLSAVSGGLTAMFLFWTIIRLISQFSTLPSQFSTIFAAFIGSACYLFCDTAWFSATESEVYSLSMLFSSMTLWAMLRWAQCTETDYAPRWLLLVALLLGLSVGVHQLTLLVIPALLVIFFSCRKQHPRQRKPLHTIIFCLLLFIIGLTPYLIIPIRAAANPPINMGDPSTLRDFKDYFTREQYEHAPLFYGRCFNSPIVDYDEGKPVYAKEMDMFFPRMWKHHPHAEQYYTDWCGRHGKMVNVNGQEYYKPSFGDNMMIFGAYQLGYMYLRYLMWNFSGRYNDRQGYGNLQKGQFITGIPPIDRLYIGTGRNLPDSMPSAGHNRYFMLPLILGLVGLFFHPKRNKSGFWTIMTLFLMGGPMLAVYLNHPMYEPRERDYAYILSFYAFAIWIGIGALSFLSYVPRWLKTNKSKSLFHYSKYIILLALPLLMACQNWNDHDRSGRYIARDSAANLLDSCNENALLFTLGDNDTFPLWYLQQCEGYRTDVQVINLSLLGSNTYTQSIKEQLLRQGVDLLPNDNWSTEGPFRRMMYIIGNAENINRPVHFSHYAYNDPRVHCINRIQLCGMAYILTDSISADSVDLVASHRLMTKVLKWHNLEGVYIDEVAHNFLRQYWRDALLSAENLATKGLQPQAHEILDSTAAQIPLTLMHDPNLMFDAAQGYLHCGDTQKASSLLSLCRHSLAEQLEYYNSMSPSMRQLIPYTLEPLIMLQQKINN